MASLIMPLIEKRLHKNQGFLIQEPPPELWNEGVQRTQEEEDSASLYGTMESDPRYAGLCPSACLPVPTPFP